ncbi:MAG: hypothetical protein A3D39_03595 [Candidatus Buchananbacteria bacterium RIFCSPHIGHO2_02_FULL_39_17]|uniref:Uncharacterized protein n=1 Tax=Candidatus Buchananbacteria bacterium RIFCSPLOWO2_01_FULL_40_23b TaxID=1797544 RepID=A0A1G1YQ93_9BACT|nr:MAG: hypothetical protein A3D39_03595 [Candidatus Buchananbacteria bacterium RIFCSPHIGHO2_02_FULL_39_17]OGY54464.1 MAG: hypothetical protein A2912_05730 [Candidatus Buchananbacteria bacterium RIFCSPLOWO2_01_FULL_40_23b]
MFLYEIYIVFRQRLYAPSGGNGQFKRVKNFNGADYQGKNFVILNYQTVANNDKEMAESIQEKCQAMLKRGEAVEIICYAFDYVGNVRK